MRLTFDQIRFDAELVRGLTGQLPSAVEAIVAEVRPRFEANKRERLDRPGRKRAIGAGRRYGLDAGEQAFLTLIWLRHSLKYSALGHLFGVSEWTVMRAVDRMVPLLKETDRVVVGAEPARCQRAGLDSLLNDFPQLGRLIAGTAGAA